MLANDIRCSFLERGNFCSCENRVYVTALLHKEMKSMKQLNNSSTLKGRRVFTRRILFFLFLILAVIALLLGLYLKRSVELERKQDKIEKEITAEKEKKGAGKLHKKYKDMIGWR